MATIIEDITDRSNDAHRSADAAHDAAAVPEDDEVFHDAADSEDSFEDATEHFDVDSLSAAQQRAQQAADAGEENCDKWQSPAN